MELDRVPLWRGNHVEIKQLVEDFARYLYLPRVKDPAVLLAAVRDGLSLLLWHHESFAYADSFDEEAERYRGLRCGQQVAISADNMSGVLVKPEVAQRQQDVERPDGPEGKPVPPGAPEGPVPEGPAPVGPDTPPTLPPKHGPKRFHGSVILDTTRVGRDASRIADEIIAHLSGLVGSRVEVTLEIEAEIPSGAPDHVVRTVTENSRTLKFTSQGFEEE